MTLVLGLDTASRRFALVLAGDGVVIRSLERDAGLHHSRLLLPAVEEILGSDRGSLAGIVVVQGPGSYAGLRVGLATAAGLATALGIGVSGVGTMEAIAAAAKAAVVTSIHPAGRGEFAVQQFRGGEATSPLALGRPQFSAQGTLAGEGAEALGGVEVTPLQRCRAALAIALARGLPFRSGTLEPVYLREPHISQPRRSRMSRAASR